MFGKDSRRGRRLVVLLGLLVLLAAATVPAFATDAVGHGPTEGKLNWDAIEPPDMKALLNDQVYLDSAARSQAQAQAEQREHDSADEKQAREESQDRFADVSGASAQDLAQQKFPELMHQDLDAVHLPEGAHVRSYLSANVARVVDSEGRRSLLVDTQPLAAQDASGELQPVDLALHSSGDVYVASDPATDVSIPKTADDYLQVGDQGLGVRPADAPAATGLREDDRVFYPEVDNDTDFISTPTRGGAEVMWQLRSAAAGEDLPLDLDLPEGATARLTSGLTAPIGQTATPDATAVEIVKDGTVIDTISPPVAADADGTSIPATYRLDGNQLTVEVPHRSRDVKYPIVVDPDVLEVYADADFSSNCGGGGWYHQTWGQAMSTYCYDASRNGGGLWIASYDQPYDNDARTQWVWSVPNYVQIDSVWMDRVWVHSSGTHMYAGIAGPSRWNSPVVNVYDDKMNDQFRINASYGADNMNSFVMGLYEDCCWGATKRPSIAWAGFNGIQILLGDGNAPWNVHLWGASQNIADINPNNAYGMQYGLNRWISAQGSYTVYLKANDDGLGLKAIGTARMRPRSATDLTGDTDDYLVSGGPNNCTGNRAGPCPLSVSGPQPLNLTGQNGVIGLHTYATDIVGNTSHGESYFMKVDHDPPAIAFSGQAATSAGVSANPSIHVEITDGDNSSPSRMQSGVRAVTVNLMDPSGNLVKNWTWSNPQSDATSNNAGLDYTLPTASNGTYSLRVDAFDDVGHSSHAVQTVNVVGYPTSWNYDRDGDHQITTRLEVDAVFTALAGASDAQWQVLWNGLSPADQTRVDAMYYDPSESDEHVFDVPYFDASTGATAAGLPSPSWCAVGSGHKVELFAQALWVDFQGSIGCATAGSNLFTYKVRATLNDVYSGVTLAESPQGSGWTTGTGRSIFRTPTVWWNTEDSARARRKKLSIRTMGYISLPGDARWGPIPEGCGLVRPLPAGMAANTIYCDGTSRQFTLRP